MFDVDVNKCVDVTLVEDPERNLELFNGTFNFNKVQTGKVCARNDQAILSGAKKDYYREARLNDENIHTLLICRKNQPAQVRYVIPMWATNEVRTNGTFKVGEDVAIIQTFTVFMPGVKMLDKDRAGLLSGGYLSDGAVATMRYDAYNYNHQGFCDKDRCVEILSNPQYIPEFQNIHPSCAASLRLREHEVYKKDFLIYETKIKSYEVEVPFVLTVEKLLELESKVNQLLRSKFEARKGDENTTD